MTATHRLIPFRISQRQIRSIRTKPVSVSLFDEILTLALEAEHPPTVDATFEEYLQPTTSLPWC
jgi:hypothetical protein